MTEDWHKSGEVKIIHVKNVDKAAKERKKSSIEEVRNTACEFLIYNAK